MIISSLADGEILDANRSYERLLGYSIEELKGNNGLSLGIYSDPAERQQIVEVLQRDGFVHDYEATLYAKSGEPKWVLFSLELMELEGQPCMLASMFDITERKRAEEALQARERYLALLNDMTKTILLSRDFASTLNVLAVDMAKLLRCGSIAISPAGTPTLNKVIPSTVTAKPDRLLSEFGSGPGEHDLTASVLQAGHALAIDDVLNSPFIDPTRDSRILRVHSMLGIPLIAGDHKLGAALITFDEPRHLHIGGDQPCGTGR